jgi:hypothetical protein
LPIRPEVQAALSRSPVSRDGNEAPIDFWTVAAVGVSLALATLGALVSIYDQWAKKHRTTMVVGFVALGLVGTITAIVAAAKSSLELQDANARMTDAVDRAKKEITGRTVSVMRCLILLLPRACTKLTSWSARWRSATSRY